MTDGTTGVGPTAPVSEFADLVLRPAHDAETLLDVLGDPYRYAHCLDVRA